MDLKPQSSFRCKSRSSDKMNRYDPLEKRRIVFLDRNREQKSLPLISKEFNIRINFPLYYEPSSNEMDNFNSMNSSKWIHDCKMFESSLNSIVHLPYFRYVFFCDDEILFYFFFKVFGLLSSTIQMFILL